MLRLLVFLAVGLNCCIIAQAETRAPWTTSRLVGSPDPTPPYQLKRVFPQLQFDRPTDMAMLPGANQWFVLELKGKVRSFKNDGSATETNLVVDLSTAIPKLDRAYGITFHPKVDENRCVFVSYVGAAGDPEGTHVSRFRLSQLNPPKIDPTTEEVLLTWLSGGHNGACLKFGPDGCLYISTGDGGPAFPPDPLKSGQDVSNLLASILRIDVDRTERDLPYRIPDDNPFVTEPRNARGEVWCYGHRNPWKMSFDSATGDLWVGDVGWEMWEMIYKVEKGGNYGWSVMEGSQRVHHDRPVGPTPILPPTVQHSHTEARSITGGIVYRGKRHADLQGRYVYGDYVTGKFWAARPKANADSQLSPEDQVEVREIAHSPLQVITFAEDDQRELFVVDHAGGIFQLESDTAVARNEDFPTHLSQTGLFADAATLQAAPGVLPYSIRVEPWADGATAERHVAIPGNGVLGLEAKHNPQTGQIKGNWSFPDNSVLAKTVSIETVQGDPSTRRRLETQVLHRNRNEWRPYTYVWNEDQTDAILAPAGGSQLSLEIRDSKAPDGRRQLNYRVASRSECVMCHTARGGVVYGFRPQQLDRVRDDASSTDESQLDWLQSVGLFADPISEHPVFSDWNDKAASSDEQARSYLEVNCAHCHRRGGGGTAALELPYPLKLERTHLLDEPTQGTFNLLGARVVAPSDPWRSVLYYRMAKLGKGRMPHFGSQVVDELALVNIRDWISGMAADESQHDLVVASLRQRQKSLLDDWIKAGDAASLSSLLTTTSGALLVRNQLAGAADDRRAQAVKLGAAHEDPRVRDLFESFVPEDQRVKRLGNVIDVAELLRAAGDAARGEKLFTQGATIQCRNCHQVGDVGKELGPPLTKIAHRQTKAQILESLIEPSKKIDPKYRVYTALTDDGKLHSGLLVDRNDQQTVLRDPRGKTTTLPAESIERIVVQQLSFMPDLLLRDMTKQQVADLLAYLMTLK